MAKKNNYISIKEAADLVERSQTTIRRLCKKFEDTEHIQKDGTKYLINKDFVLEHYNISTPSLASSPKVETVEGKPLSEPPQKSQVSNKLTNLETENELLRSELQLRDERIQNDEKLLKLAQEKTRLIEQKLAKKEAIINELEQREAKIRELENLYQNHENQITFLEEQLAKRTNEAESSLKYLNKTKETEINALQTQLKDQQREYEQAKKEIERLREKQVVLNQDLQTKNKDLGELKGKFTAAVDDLEKQDKPRFEATEIRIDVGKVALIGLGIAFLIFLVMYFLN